MTTIYNDPLADVCKGKHRNSKCWCESGKKIKNCDCATRMKEKEKIANKVKAEQESA